METIKEIGKHPLFTSALTQKAINKYTNEDIVIKSYSVLTQETPSFDTKDIRPLMSEAVISEEEKNTIMAVYDKLLATYAIVTNPKIQKKMFTRTHLLALVPIIKLATEMQVTNEKVAEFCEYFFDGGKVATVSDKYNSKVGSASGKPDSVRTRNTAIKESFLGFIIC